MSALVRTIQNSGPFKKGDILSAKLTSLAGNFPLIPVVRCAMPLLYELNPISGVFFLCYITGDTSSITVDERWA